MVTRLKIDNLKPHQILDLHVLTEPLTEPKSFKEALQKPYLLDAMNAKF